MELCPDGAWSVNGGCQSAHTSGSGASSAVVIGAVVAAVAAVALLVAAVVTVRRRRRLDTIRTRVGPGRWSSPIKTGSPSSLKVEMDVSISGLIVSRAHSTLPSSR
jgi:hypothetical protein